MTTLDQQVPVTVKDHAAPAAPAAGEAPPRRTALKVAGGVVITLLLAGLVALAGAVVVVPRVIGAVPLTVLSGSMEPTLSPGDLVVSQPVDAEDIRVGDVVTFQPESGDPTLVTHRVLGITLGAEGVTGFVTRGDANSATDDPIVNDQVMGRVVYSIPLVGHLTNMGWGPQAVGVGAIGLLVYGLVVLVAPDRKNREEVQHA